MIFLGSPPGLRNNLLKIRASGFLRARVGKLDIQDIGNGIITEWIWVAGVCWESRLACGEISALRREMFSLNWVGPQVGSIWALEKNAQKTDSISTRADVYNLLKNMNKMGFLGGSYGWT